MPIRVRPLIFATIGEVNEMEITVKRGPGVKDATIGELFLDGVFQCYTLEDPVREVQGEPVSAWKIQNKTAIPRGRYKIVLHNSPHFGCVLPMLVGVPGYDYVLIHWGNTAIDTDGCILVGQTKEANLIYKSRDAFKALFPKIQSALAAGPVFLTIS